MKRNKKLIILLLVLIVAVAVCVLVKKLAPKEDSVDKANVTFSEIKQEDITALEWTSGGETNKFLKTDSGWSLEGDDAFPANSVTLDSMKNTVSDAKSTRALSGVKPEDYGINDTADRIIVTRKDGSEVKMIFGNKNDVTSEYYMQVEGDDNIYMIPAATKDSFKHTKKDLIKKEAIPSMQSVSKLTITKGDKALELNYAQTGEGDEKTGTWTSGDTTLDTTKTDAVKNALANIIWTDCVSYNAGDSELTQYGLAQPAAIMKAETPDGEVEVEFGSESGEYVYARLKDSKMIYTVDKTVMDSMVTDTSTLVSQ